MERWINNRKAVLRHWLNRKGKGRGWIGLMYGCVHVWVYVADQRLMSNVILERSRTSNHIISYLSLCKVHCTVLYCTVDTVSCSGIYCMSVYVILYSSLGVRTWKYSMVWYVMTHCVGIFLMSYSINRGRSLNNRYW